MSCLEGGSDGCPAIHCVIVIVGAIQVGPDGACDVNVNVNIAGQQLPI